MLNYWKYKENFQKKVKDTEDLPSEYQNKESFLHSVIKKSIELKVAKEFYKISQLNVGVVASGSIFQNIDGPSFARTDARFSLSLGYDTLPNILIANSLKRTAKIDLRKEYIKMLNYARRSYDLYKFTRGYTEAKRSLKMNRKAFKENLKHLLTKKKEPDAFFFLSLEQLLKSELKLNAALHGSLKAKAHLERFLFQDKDKISRYFPKKENLKVFSKTKNKNLLAQKKLDKLILFLSK